MATEIKLPRLGQGMESGTIVKWLKSEGERVEKGEPLYELDTDKVTQEVEADAGGVLLKIAVQEGEVPVGRTVAVIGEEGEDVPDTNGDQPKAEAKATVPEETEEGETPGRVQPDEGGAEVAAVIQYQAFDWLDAPIERVGAVFAPLAFAPVMEQFAVPHAGDVLEAIYRTVGRTA